jgi:hypothetical protein
MDNGACGFVSKRKAVVKPATIKALRAYRYFMIQLSNALSTSRWETLVGTGRLCGGSYLRMSSYISGLLGYCRHPKILK